MSASSEIFEDLKVLELASVLAGPSVGQFFAELGAQVLKIENPKTGGDVTRSWTLPDEDVKGGVSSYFACANWGKQSMFLDLAAPEAKKIVLAHARETDIIISSYKPGDAEKLGLDYQKLKTENPRLIYAHITGYGPESIRAGYDAVVQAESGFMHINGEKNSKPLKLPVALVDLLAAHQLKEGILVALLRRERTGEGTLVEVSLFDAAVSSLANQATNWLVGGKEPEAMGSAHPNIAPYGTVYSAADGGEIILAIGNDRQFQQLCQSLEISEVALDERYSTNRQRVINRSSLDEILVNGIMKFTRDDILCKLQSLKVPAGAVRKVSEALRVAEEHGMIMENQQLKSVRQIAFKLDQQRGFLLSHPPHVD